MHTLSGQWLRMHESTHHESGTLTMMLMQSLPVPLPDLAVAAVLAALASAAASLAAPA